ncbi:site-specific DNA-methyltransferase [candidate division KSB1 bacterium]|nr:site-specific DNA-methyltransferase [candidate division KSB1 bacterium]
MNAVDPKNRMNELTSREWLQFQKSWFVLENFPLPDFIRFFTKSNYENGHSGHVGVYPTELIERNQKELPEDRSYIAISNTDSKQAADYVYIDLTDINSRAKLFAAKTQIDGLIAWCRKNLGEQKYITIAAQNIHGENGSQPIAWEITKWFSEFFAQKDEKIGCRANSEEEQAENQNGWAPRNTVTYFLHFRKEKELPRQLTFELPWPEEKTKSTLPKSTRAYDFTENWYIHRPPRREKGVLLHPAKFPEDLVERYIQNFTSRGEWVLDPMAGTGSSLLAAANCGRHAAGIELNPEFVEIAKARFAANAQIALVTGDAVEAKSYTEFPMLDYAITSPPYWDMLRMRGAETQQKRKAAGLQRWYSEDPNDAGNIADYLEFIKLLAKIYHHVALKLKPGGYFTIIVKNVKKKGVIYPLAWDIVAALKEDYIYCGEQFWCQDDQRLSPFGYRYAWVSNTFHHYCLTFRRKG